MQVRDRVRELRRVRAADLRPSPKNWRTHPQAQQDALCGLLAEIGYADALLARELADGSLMLIDGHLRAETTPDALVPVLILDVDEAEADKLLATLDPLAAMATADATRLEALLASISTSSGAVQSMLDGLKEANPLPLPEAGGGGDEFDATPEEGPTRTALGDLWVIGGKHRLLVGDCTLAENVVRLMDGVKADAIIADPPYGVDFKRGQFITDPTRRGGRARGVGDELQGDARKGDEQREFIRDCFLAWKAHSRQAATVYMWSASLQPGSHSMFGMQDAGIHIQSQLIWAKSNLVLGQCDYQWKHEVCWYGWYKGDGHQWFGGRDKTTILEFKKMAATGHPSEKPLEMIEHLLANSTQPDGVVADPFLGSGTTLIAAHRLGRTCYGCELDPRYADVILKRAEAEGLECVKEEAET